MTHDVFLLRLMNLASTAAHTPPWGRVQFWVDVMVPFLSEAYETGDDKVRGALDVSHRHIMKSQNHAFAWLKAFDDG